MLQRIIYILLITCICYYSANAGNTDSVKTGQLPLHDGYAIKSPRPVTSMKVYNAQPGIQIYSRDNRVYAVEDGQVISAMQIDGAGYTLVIKKDAIYYVYSNLNKTQFHRGDNITKGTEIGNAMPADEAQNYTMVFQVWHAQQGGKSERYSAEKTEKLLVRQ